MVVDYRTSLVRVARAIPSQSPRAVAAADLLAGAGVHKEGSGEG